MVKKIRIITVQIPTFIEKTYEVNMEQDEFEEIKLKNILEIKDKEDK